MKKKGGRHWFSFQNFVNYYLDPQVAPKEGASCFASSNSFSKQEHLYSGGPSLPRLLIFKTSAHLNADHQILTFRGLSSNFQSHKVFVGHHGKRYDARCHFSRGHPFWFWTFNSLQICGHFGLKNDCWESSDSELRERRIPFAKISGRLAKMSKVTKKRKGIRKLEIVAVMRINGIRPHYDACNVQHKRWGWAISISWGKGSVFK